MERVGGKFENILGWVWIRVDPTYQPNQREELFKWRSGTAGGRGDIEGLDWGEEETPHDPAAQPLPSHHEVRSGNML